MATSTPAIVDAVISALEANLPALVTAQGLTAITGYYYGDHDLRAAGVAPFIWVDLTNWDQGGEAAGGFCIRTYDLLIVVGVVGADAEATARETQGYVDLICKVLETYPVADAMPTIVSRAVLSESMAEASSLFRFAAITARIKDSRTRGDA